jgi:hypothetical protein
MLLYPRKRPQERHKFRAQRAAVSPPPPPPPPPPAVLTLVSAAFDNGESALTLNFDREIDMGGVDVSVFFVNDANVTGFLFQGIGSPEQPSGQTLRVLMTGISGVPEPGELLNVGAGNGVVSVEGGLVWAGIGPVGLPYP